MTAIRPPRIHRDELSALCWPENVEADRVRNVRYHGAHNLRREIVGEDSLSAADSSFRTLPEGHVGKSEAWLPTKHLLLEESLRHSCRNQLVIGRVPLSG